MHLKVLRAVELVHKARTTKNAMKTNTLLPFAVSLITCNNQPTTTVGCSCKLVLGLRK